MLGTRRFYRLASIKTNQFAEEKTPSQWQLLLLMLVGFILPLMGDIGKVFGYAILLVVGFLFLDMLLKGKQSSSKFFFLLGFIIGGEAFFRDYVMRGFVGYMVVEYLITALGLLSLAPILRQAKKIPKSIIPWALFCVWAVLSLFNSVDPLRGRWFLIIYLSGLFVMLLCSAFNQGNLKMHLLYGMLSGVCLAFGTILYNEIFRPSGAERFGHSFLSAVQVGIFLTVGLMCVFLLVQIYNKKILQFIIPIITLSMGAVLTFSRGPVLGLGIMLTFLVLNPKIHRAGGSNFRLILFVVLLTGALYLFLTTTYLESTIERYGDLTLDTGRQNAWTRSIELWRQKPLTGWGIGSWARIYPLHYQSSMSDAHNFVFQILVETGLVGLILTTVFLFSVLISLLIKRRFADLGILAYIVSVGLVENWKIAIYFGLFALIFAGNISDVSVKKTKATNALDRI